MTVLPTIVAIILSEHHTGVEASRPENGHCGRDGNACKSTAKVAWPLEFISKDNNRTHR